MFTRRPVARLSMMMASWCCRCECVRKVRADEPGPAGDDVAHEESMLGGGLGSSELNQDIRLPGVPAGEDACSSPRPAPSPAPPPPRRPRRSPSITSSPRRPSPRASPPAPGSGPQTPRPAPPFSAAPYRSTSRPGSSRKTELLGGLLLGHLSNPPGGQ